MKVRIISPLAAAALGVCLGGSAVAADTAKPTATGIPQVQLENQQLANKIAERLTTTGSSAGAEVKIGTEAGVVTVTGTCRDADQKKSLLQDIRVIPGVKMVRDGIKVGGVKQVQATAPVGPVATMPPIGVPPSGPGEPTIEPVPLGPGGMGPADGMAPPLPPHAWPTYAPYNNLSRVAYPQAYPYNAFPFIGPFYPFPKVPLGWRTVQLEWEDGHWWLGKKSAPYDYWRVRFW